MKHCNISYYVISGFWYFHQNQKYKCFMLGSSIYAVIFANVRDLGVERQNCLLSTQTNHEEGTLPLILHAHQNVLPRSHNSSDSSQVLTKYAWTTLTLFYYISFIQVACTLTHKLLNFSPSNFSKLYHTQAKYWSAWLIILYVSWKL